MNDSEDNQGGHETELSRATTRMADAIAAGDADVLRMAASDHAAALGSQATAMAASIAKPVYTKLEEIMLLLSTQAQQSEYQARLARDHAEQQANMARSWLGDEAKRRDVQADRLYSELDELKSLAVEGRADLGKLSTQVGEMGAALIATIGRVSNVEEVVSEHGLTLATHGRHIQEVRIDVAAIQARVDTLQAGLQDVRSRLAGLEADHAMFRKVLEAHPQPDSLKRHAG